MQMTEIDSKCDALFVIARFFTDVRIGAARDDWRGVDEQVWIVDCIRAH
jgi:hypothetical protein